MMPSHDVIELPRSELTAVVEAVVETIERMVAFGQTEEEVEQKTLAALWEFAIRTHDVVSAPNPRSWIEKNRDRVMKAIDTPLSVEAELAEVKQALDRLQARRRNNESTH